MTDLLRTIFHRVILNPFYRRYEQELFEMHFANMFSSWKAKYRTESAERLLGLDADYANRYRLYADVVDTCRLQNKRITYLEFGVAGGASLKWWLEANVHELSMFVGFDSFLGLPSDWESRPKGTFSSEGRPPEIEDSRCQFVVGLFKDTIDNFLSDRLEGDFHHPLIVHLDADLYESTLLVLFALTNSLKPGDLLIFDEFSSVLHEFRALHDWGQATGRGYKLVGEVNDFRQVAIQILE